MEENKTTNSRIIRNTLFLSVRMIFNLCVSLYTTRVVLRVLGVEDYGIYNVVCGFVAMFAFLNTTMSNGIQRFYNAEIGKGTEGSVSRIYSAALLIQLILLVIILLLTETIGIWYINNKLNFPLERLFGVKTVFQLSVLSYIFVILQVPYSALTLAAERMDFFSLVSVLDTILKLAIAFLLPFLGYDKLICYGAFHCALSLINFLLFYLYSKKKFPEVKFDYNIDKGSFKSIFVFSGWNVFGTFANMMKEQGLNMILNFYYGPIVNAARALSYQVLSALQGFVGNVNIAVRPQIVQSYVKAEYDRCLSLMYNQSKLSLGILCLLSYPILLELDHILIIWLGNDVPHYTNIFITIVVLTSFVNNMNTAVSAIIHASGNMKRYQLITSIITLSSLPVIIILCKYGASPYVAFILGLIFTIVMQIASLFILKTVISFRIMEYSKQVILPFIKSFLCSFVWPLIPHYFMNDSIYKIIVVMLISVISYFICYYMLCLTDNEREFVKHFIQRKVNVVK